MIAVKDKALPNSIDGLKRNSKGKTESEREYGCEETV
jgi:hypothetical protein